MGSAIGAPMSQQAQAAEPSSDLRSDEPSSDLRSDEPHLDLSSNVESAVRRVFAVRDLSEGLAQWRLGMTLGWLDIKLRYRGSVIGPFWLTLSTAVMVIAMGVLYATLFHMELHDYIPFLALSLVLFNAISAMVGEACGCFTSAEGMIRSVRMPFTIYAVRAVVRNGLVLAHNIVVIVGVFLFFDAWPGAIAAQSLLGLAFWLVDAIAVCLLLGTVCARFRDIGPIVGNIMQIAFFLTPIIWRKDSLGEAAVWLFLNPFYCLLTVVREPLLNQHPGIVNWIALFVWSGLLCGAAWWVFARTRSRIAFWV
jgi:lipopolysaccharide transport system permease protein